MANIKDLKKKLKSTKNTFKITSAMKLVSAAKLNRAQATILGARPYANELESSIKAISALTKDYSHPYLAQSENKKSILLVISSDKGLCGSFNSNLAKAIRVFLNEKAELDFKVYFIGKKVRELILKNVNAGKTFTFAKAEPKFKEVTDLASELVDLFSSGEVGSIYVGYNLFQSAMSIKPTITQVLPISLPHDEKEKLKEEFPFDFKYEPNPKDILDNLIPQAYITSIYTKVLDSIASEHGARMTAMDSATKNSKEMIKKITIKMNKLRQASITTELIEVVSGAEALNS